MVAQFVQNGREALGADLPLDASDAVAVAWTRLEERRSPMLRLQAPDA